MSVIWRIFQHCFCFTISQTQVSKYDSPFGFWFLFKLFVHMNNSRENRQVPYIWVWLQNQDVYPQLKSWIWRTTCTFRTWSLDIWRVILCIQTKPTKSMPWFDGEFLSKIHLFRKFDFWESSKGVLKWKLSLLILFGRVVS